MGFSPLFSRGHSSSQPYKSVPYQLAYNSLFLGIYKHKVGSIKVGQILHLEGGTAFFNIAFLWGWFNKLNLVFPGGIIREKFAFFSVLNLFQPNILNVNIDKKCKSTRKHRDSVSFRMVQKPPDYREFNRKRANFFPKGGFLRWTAFFEKCHQNLVQKRKNASYFKSPGFSKGKYSVSNFISPGETII